MTELNRRVLEPFQTKIEETSLKYVALKIQKKKMWLEEAAILQDTQLANGGFRCLCRYPIPVPCEGYGIKGIVTLPMSLLSWINVLEGSWRA